MTLRRVLVELTVTEQRYRAVLEIQAGSSVIEVAERFGVSRQAVRRWLAWYRDEGLAGLADRSSRPHANVHSAPLTFNRRSSAGTSLGLPGSAGLRADVLPVAQPVRRAEGRRRQAPLAGCLVACQASHMTEEIVGALAIARAEFERRLTAITDDDWGRPTPCTEWNVRQLVNHIVSHEYRYADNLATNNSKYYVASRDDDFLGDDPHGSWLRGVALLDEAVAGLDSLETTISFLLPLPARDVLLVRVFEAAVHTWDVSRAIGFDERIDERLAMLTYPLLERLIQAPATQAFFAAPQDTLPTTAAPQDRLLHLAGRKP